MIGAPPPGSAIVSGYTDEPNYVFIPLADAVRLVHVRRTIDSRDRFACDGSARWPVALTWGDYRRLVDPAEWRDTMELFDGGTFEEYFADEFWKEAVVPDYGWKSWYSRRSKEGMVVSEPPANAYAYCVDVLPASAHALDELREWHASAVAAGEPVPCSFDVFRRAIEGYPNAVEEQARQCYASTDIETRCRHPLDTEMVFDVGTDGNWPDWPAVEMLKWLPREITENVGIVREGGIVIDDCLDLSEDDDAERVTESLRRLGYVVMEDDALVSEACGFRAPAAHPELVGRYACAPEAERDRRTLVLDPSGTFIFTGEQTGFVYCEAAGGWEADRPGDRRAGDFIVVRLTGVVRMDSDAGAFEGQAFQRDLLVHMGDTGIVLVGSDSAAPLWMSTSGRFSRTSPLSDDASKLIVTARQIMTSSRPCFGEAP